MKTVLRLFTLLVPLVSALVFGLQPADFDTAAEQEIVRLLNQSRQQAGLAPLVIDDRLTSAARQHTALMVQQGQLSHQFAGEPALSKRLAATGIRFNFDGENVAYDSGTPAEVHLGLMNSPPHRANIMNPEFNAVGVGVVHKDDLIYVTEDFARRVQEYSPGEAENAAANAFAGARTRAGFAAISRVGVPAVRTLACDMARTDRLETRAALQQGSAHYAVSYTEAQPDKLPSSAARLATDPTLKRFAVGACYAATEHYPGGTWWVVMVFY